MKLTKLLIPCVVVLVVIGMVSWAARLSEPEVPAGSPGPRDQDVRESTLRIDALFEDHWNTEQISPATEADPLQVLRRLSLALHGTIPSLEEIREFEADKNSDRLERWASRMLADDRFGDYFAERLARGFVGTEGGQFVIYRRDRFVDWLSDQLRQNRPYDEIVRTMIVERGLWTGKPATNFITAAINEGEVDENKLAGRCVRAFLGQRMDCAQCHDHPFDDWKQSDFEGLAAYFGQAKLSVVGIEDDSNLSFEVEDRITLEKRTVEPKVPFHSEWLGPAEDNRQKLSAWITHPENRRFTRAAANRIWGYLFGRPYIAPVDDLPDPEDSGKPDLLDILGEDFRQNDYDVKHMIRVIVASKPFRLASICATDNETDNETEIERLRSEWAVFSLTRLRPEQIIGSMLQATSITTVDQNSHLMIRAIRFFRENDFVKEYGDLGENELEDRSGTIPQALLRMNGNLPREMTEANLLNSSGRIADLAGDDPQRLEACYLVCLSRRPTPPERDHFLKQLSGSEGDEKKHIIEDVFWSLFNSPEFAWNH